MYFDYAATTPIDASVLETFTQAQKIFYGNPDSLHEVGRKSARLIEDAKCQIASLLSINEEEIFFTSGATEANNLAIFGTEIKKDGNVVTSISEHASISEPLNELERRGIEVRRVGINLDGTINLSMLLEQVDAQTKLLSLIHVNNEIGSCNDVAEIAKQLKSLYPKLIIHIDMAQSIGKVSIDLTNIDLATFSGHKFYAPKGIGMLYKKQHIQLKPLIYGGQQQDKIRPGTLNAAQIASFAKAMRLAIENFDQRLMIVQKLNKRMRLGIEAFKVLVPTIPQHDKIVPHILHLYLNEQTIQIETLIHALSEEEIYVSTRSTCHSKSLSKQNDILVGLGYSAEESRFGLRISMSHLTTNDEVDAFICVLGQTLDKYVVTSRDGIIKGEK